MKSVKIRNTNANKNYLISIGRQFSVSGGTITLPLSDQEQYDLTESDKQLLTKQIQHASEFFTYKVCRHVFSVL